jgi:SNF2 family DNA or RNA helicase
MIDTAYITVYSQWIPSRGVFLCAETDTGQIIDTLALKTVLFSWHEKSYYGTFIKTDVIHNVEGLLLSPVMALDYFSDPSPLQHQTIHWSDLTRQFLSIADDIKTAISKGSFHPDFHKWQSGEWGWKVPLDIMDTSAASLASEWVDAIFTEWTQNHDEIRQTWDKAVSEFPLIEVSIADRVNWSEDEWLISIGWKPDPSPFCTVLQLNEPGIGDDTDQWTLHLILQDRDNDGIHCKFPFEQKSLPPHWFEHLARFDKDVQKILQIVPWLEGETEGFPIMIHLSEEEAWIFLTQSSLDLAQAGMTILLPAWWADIKKSRPRLIASIKSSVGTSKHASFGINQLMEFDWKLAIGEESLSELEFIEILNQKKKLIQLGGQWIQLDTAMLQQLQQLVSRVKKQRGLTLGEVLEAHLLQEEGSSVGDDLKINVELSGSFQRMIEQLQETRTIPLVSPPDTLQAKLRGYQNEGMSWLLFLRQFGLGACLADDMGLGKTIQWIAYLLSVKEREKPPAPSLLICPTSVLGNWQKELERFAPSLQVYLHYGGKRVKGDAFVQHVAQYDLVLTSYTLAHLDEEVLQTIDWSSIGLDEAQNIKNAFTKQSSSIRRLNGHHRVAMTGTPIENRLTELWSIYDFINPGYLGGLREFSRRFVDPIEKGQNPKLITDVQQMVRPFLLRRVKTDPTIQLDLPDKTESKEYISLTVEQASLYESVLQDLFERLERVSPMERRGLILASLTKLKQVCNHPALFLKETEPEPDPIRSPKVERLLEMIDQLRTENERCLIFTQYVEMGHMLKRMIQQQRQESVLFLHGGLSKVKRDQLIQSFQETVPSEESNPIFILSLKAGGIGLNLTEANHVFHVDRWWNPAVENQATDRAYRIGQSRHVQVHKFITLGTLEERIDEMIERKLDLSQQIVGSGDNWVTELSTSELKELVTLRKNWME